MRPAFAARLVIHEVELIFHLVDKVLLFVLVVQPDHGVVDPVLVRHGRNLTRLRAEWVRHVVIDPVAEIFNALGGNVIGRIP